MSSPQPDNSPRPDSDPSETASERPAERPASTSPDLVSLAEEQAAPAPPEKERRWLSLPMVVLLVALVLCVGLLAEEKRQTQLLASQVSGLEGELGEARAAIEAYEVRLSDIRTRVGTIFTQVADLQAVVDGRPPTTQAAPTPVRAEVPPAPVETPAEASAPVSVVEPAPVMPEPEVAGDLAPDVGLAPRFGGDVFSSDRFDPRTPAVF